MQLQLFSPQLSLELLLSATSKIKSKRSRKFVFVASSVSVLFAKTERSKTRRRLLILFIFSSPKVRFLIINKSSLVPYQQIKTKYFNNI